MDRLWMMDPGIRLTTRRLGNASRRLGGRCGTMHKRNWWHGTLMIWWLWQALDNLRNFSRLIHDWNLFCSWGPSSWFWSPGWTSASRWLNCGCTSLNIDGLGWQAQGWGVWIWHGSCSSLLPTLGRHASKFKSSWILAKTTGHNIPHRALNPGHHGKPGMLPNELCANLTYPLSTKIHRSRPTQRHVCQVWGTWQPMKWNPQKRSNKSKCGW